MDEPTKRITPTKCATVLAFLLFALGALFELLIQYAAEAATIGQLDLVGRRDSIQFQPVMVNDWKGTVSAALQ